MADAELATEQIAAQPETVEKKQGAIIFFLVFVLVILVLLVSSRVGALIGLIIALIAIIIAVAVTAHILIKLSTIFRPWSTPCAKADPDFKPFVSIHVACKNEPASLVNKTINVLTKLDYKNFEVIVIHSNNQSTKNWQKIQQFVESCGKNFKFVHEDQINGFKAGALNYVNNHVMDKKAEIVAIIDCDYIVAPEFLNETVGYFKDPKIGIVQLPQDYHNVNRHNIGLAYEYRSFFALVMHQAQRMNLVTFTGTMGLIRTNLVGQGLKWSEWCITEDAEAGAYINSIGYRGVFVDKTLGKGLMPLDYTSIIKQRRRWAFGNMQILGKDLMSILKNQVLSIQQKFSFLAQLVTWFHFELIIAVSYLSINFTRLFGYHGRNINFASNLMLVLLAMSLIGNFIYFMVGLRKETSILQRFQAFLTHYGLIYVMSASWLLYFSGHQLGFSVTKKEKTSNSIPISQYAKELSIMIILLIGLGLAALFGFATRLDMAIIGVFVIIELAGILYLRNAFTKSNS